MALEHAWLPDRWPSLIAPRCLAGPTRWLMRHTNLRHHDADPASTDGRTRSVAVAQVSASDTDEFETFVHRHERKTLNYLWRMTGDEQSAYDLTQEVFVRAWRHFGVISQYEQPHAWLFRVATNLALRHNSSRRRQATPISNISELPNDAPGASDPARGFAESELVRQILLRLPLRRRAALVLREVYGLSTAEVAAALGMSETAVRMAISRAREQFRTLYREVEGLP